VFYYLFFFLLPKQKIIDPTDTLPGISIIICAHNELENLKKNLTAFLNQDYPLFEIILSLDRCTDESKAYILQLQQQFKQLNFLDIKEVPKGWNSKKYALVTASKMANYDFLVFTDADCWPKSNLWLKSYGTIFSKQDLIIGYSPHESKTGFLNDFITYETLQTAFAYLGFLKRNILYMCVGRNFGTRKDLYLDFSFSNVESVTGGDDDLYINSLSPEIKKTTIYHLDSQIITEPKDSFTSYLTQKKRHINASKYYSSKNQSIIGLYNLSGGLFYLSFSILLLLNTSFVLLFPYISGNSLFSKFKKVRIIYLDFVYFFYLWTWGSIALLSKRIKWI